MTNVFSLLIVEDGFMNNFFDRENMQKIEILNAKSGMSHRTKPYDINNIEDIDELLKYKVCSFLDYHEYEMTIADTLEHFDESMEHYDTATWLDFSMGTNKPDKLLQKCYKSLRKAADDFLDLSQRAEIECKEALNMVINCDEKTQTSVLGFTVKKTENLTETLENIFEEITDLEYEYNMEKAYENFKIFIQKFFC